jgi:integrase
VVPVDGGRRAAIGCEGGVRVSGYIRRRGKSSWEISAELATDPVTGKRRRAMRNVKGTRKEAQVALTALEHSINTGSHTDAARETVATFLSRWLRDYAQINVAARTYDRYEGIVRDHLVPSLGSIRLDQLRPAHILAAERQWLVGGRKRGAGGLSSRTVLHHHRVLREALAHAVRWQLITTNPADAVAPPRVQRTEMQAFTGDQAARLLEWLDGSEFAVPITTALYTGLRIGELLALRWRDIDFEAKRLTVQRSMYPLRGGDVAFGPTKTHQSRRPVTVPTIAMDGLRSQRRIQMERRLLAGPAWVGDPDLVFDDGMGGPLSPGRLRTAFQRVLRESGLPRLRFHDLRHTMASLMLASGEHPKVVSERLGHSTVALTLDVYSHVVPGLGEAAAERLAEVLRRRSSQ